MRGKSVKKEQASYSGFLSSIWPRSFGKRAILALVLVLCCTVSSARSETVRGMYGIPPADHPKSIRQLKDAHLTSVFAPPHQPTIGELKNAGFQVYLTLNVFGGTEAWGRYPDSVPITAAGKPVSPRHGGICPTHFAWRQERLALLAAWLQQFATASGIDGVWLDFIRYPGRWEMAQAEIPDTCYCPRCLSLFGVEKGVAIPAGLDTAATAEWIHGHAQLQWLQWKKEQITSFVREARSLVEQAQANRKTILGIFLVPWTQGERQGAVLQLLAQDAFQLARYADVLSPMLYHKMVAQPVAWVRDMGEYFVEMGRKPVWPIIQSGGVAAAGFAGAVEAVSQSGAEGLLVYSHAEMKEDFWPLLEGFKAWQNLLPNPEFKPGETGNQSLPTSWLKGHGGPAHAAQFFFQPGAAAKSGILGIAGGHDRQGTWQTALPPCDPRKKYRFSGEFFRKNLDGSDYPEIEVWGRKYLLNSHRLFGQFQLLQTAIDCPVDLQKSEPSFSFKGGAAGTTFWLRNPQLREVFPRSEDKESAVNTGFFPIGAYGASSENIPLMREMGLNSAVISLTEESVAACLENDMHCLLSVPRDTEELLVAVETKAGPLAKGRFAFYVNDEPEISSFPIWKAEDIKRILHDRFPRIPTSMAIVRPQAISDYSGSSDLFMLDQYPVPSMPMTWQADSIDQAATAVGRNRLQAVVQAFGGDEWSFSGWPRLPTFAEMNCLAFLSVIHGARGVYFYSFPAITATEQGKQDFRQVVARLQRLLPWLETVNSPESVSLSLPPGSRQAGAGKSGVHCAAKEKASQHMLLCVNSRPGSVRASLSQPPGAGSLWREIFTGGSYLAVDSTLHVDFAPLEVKVLVDAKK